MSLVGKGVVCEPGRNSMGPFSARTSVRASHTSATQADTVRGGGRERDREKGREKGREREREERKRDAADDIDHENGIS